MNDIKLNSLIENNPRLKDFKRQAKILLKQLKTQFPDKSISLGNCHDLIARQHGYQHWHELYMQIKAPYLLGIDSYYGLSKPQNGTHYNYGYNAKLGLNFWVENKNILQSSIIGTSEKTTPLNLFLAKQAIQNKEHLVYFDCSGDSTFINDLHNFSISHGREKHIKIISLLNRVEQGTINLPVNFPWSSSFLVEFINSILKEKIDNQQYLQESISLLNTVITVLCFMRDSYEILLDFQIIRDYLDLDNIIKLYKNRRDFPDHIRVMLHDYLFSISDYRPELNKQSQTTYEHHGVRQMRLMQVISALCLIKTHSLLINLQASKLSYSDLAGKYEPLIVLIPFVDLKNSPVELSFIEKFVCHCILQEFSDNLFHKMYEGSRHGNWSSTFIFNHCGFEDVSYNINTMKYQQVADSKQHFIFSSSQKELETTYQKSIWSDKSFQDYLKDRFDIHIAMDNHPFNANEYQLKINGKQHLLSIKK